MMRSTVSIALALSLLSLVPACGRAPAGAASPSSPGGDAAKTAPAANVKAPGDAKVGDTTKCPVSGEEFVVDASSPKVEHDGKTYYLCCGGCKAKFEADPAKYLKKI